MGLVRKTRVRTGTLWTSTKRSFNSAVNPAYSGQFPREVQMIFSEGHPNHNRSDGIPDTGAAFESWKVEIPRPGVNWHSRYNYVNTQLLTGWQEDTKTFLCASPEIAQLANQINGLLTEDQISSYLSNPVRCPQGPSNLTMDAMGTKAIDMIKPTNPTVDLATSLAELWSERKFFSVPGRNGSLSGEYLNYQFGIAPTIGDYQDLRDAIENRDAIIRQYQKDSGKLIRRRYRFKPEISYSVTKTSAPVYGMGHGLSIYQCPGGTLTKKTKTTQEYWFAGAFKYSIPRGAFPERMAELDRLYGVVPGVSTGWELVPFSWLVDYFTPIGGILSNLDAFMKDGLVLPYAYIMSTTEVEDTYDWLGTIRNTNGELVPLGVQSVIKKTRLRRRHATPFGFGLLASDLSPKQLSIIAALGISLRK